MTTKSQSTREEPLKIPFRFDDAIKRALKVNPPAEGWAEYERGLRRKNTPKRKKPKPAA